jgi:hypothetical protein
MKFEDLTIKQYIDLLEVDKLEISEIEKKIKKLAIVLDKKESEVENLPLTAFDKIKFLDNIPNQIKFRDKTRIGLKFYKACTDLNEIGVNQLVDFYSLHKNNAPINELLAVIYKPYNPDKHKEISKAFLDKKVGEVLGTVFFFRNYYMRCEKLIAEYLENHLKQIQAFQTEIQTDKEFQDFLNTGDGNITLTNAHKTRG